MLGTALGYCCIDGVSRDIEILLNNNLLKTHNKFEEKNGTESLVLPLTCFLSKIDKILFSIASFGVGDKLRRGNDRVAGRFQIFYFKHCSSLDITLTHFDEE